MLENNSINNNDLPGTSNTSSANNTITKSKTINFNETNDDNNRKISTSFSRIFLKLNDPSKIYSKLNINSNRKLTKQDKNYILRFVRRNLLYEYIFLVLNFKIIFCNKIKFQQ